MKRAERLIDARRFWRHLANLKLSNRGWRDDACDLLDVVMDLLDEQPTVDAVEVVRCKDCNNACPGNHGPVCIIWGAGTEPDAFCSYGERKDDEET